ncbi:MAG: GNAT family N-acetyltransferase [Candidatus Woesearchaeota archaeon]
MTISKSAKSIKSNEVKIRKATAKDIPQLIKLFSGVKEILDFAGQKHNRHYFQVYLKTKECSIIVAEQNNRICGALTVEFVPRNFTYLSNIVVSKKNRGQGIGGLLLKSLEKESKKRKINVILMLVFEWNKQMQHVVEHCEYKKHSMAIQYYKKF